MKHSQCCNMRLIFKNCKILSQNFRETLFTFLVKQSFWRIFFSVLLVWLMKLPAKKVCHTTLKSTYVTTLTIFTTAKDLAKLLSDSSVPLPPNFHLTLSQEGNVVNEKKIGKNYSIWFLQIFALSSLPSPRRWCFIHCLRQWSTKNPILWWLLCLWPSNSLLCLHWRTAILKKKNGKKFFPGILLNFYLLIIKQERITVYDMYLANPKKQVLDPQVEHQIAISVN